MPGTLNIYRQNRPKEMERKRGQMKWMGFDRFVVAVKKSGAAGTLAAAAAAEVGQAQAQHTPVGHDIRSRAEAPPVQQARKEHTAAALAAVVEVGIVAAVIIQRAQKGHTAAVLPAVMEVGIVVAVIVRRAQ